MRNYEVTFIVDPTLPGDEVAATAQKYVNMIFEAKYAISSIDELGLKQLAYQINKKHAGYYYTVEFAGEDGKVVDSLELALRRDEKILRFLTIALDRHAVKYNSDKREGKVGKRKREADAKAKAAKEELEVEADVD